MKERVWADGYFLCFPVLCLQPLPISVMSRNSKWTLEEQFFEVVHDGGDVQKKLATKAFQVFFVATDGSVCVPLGFLPTDSIDGEGAFRLLKPIIEQFAEHDIKIEWSSSDGIASNKKLIQLMKESGLDSIRMLEEEEEEEEVRVSSQVSKINNRGGERRRRGKRLTPYHQHERFKLDIGGRRRGQGE